MLMRKNPWKNLISHDTGANFLSPPKKKKKSEASFRKLDEARAIIKRGLIKI